MTNYKYLIDSSYLVYYTSFSAFNTYIYQNDIAKSELREDYDPTIDPEFCQILQHKLSGNILNPIKQIFPIIEKSNIVFCLDCARKNIWRRQIYPQYKISRDLHKSPQQLQFNVGNVFKYVYNFTIPKLCEEYGAMKIFSEFAQGDDIIAVLNKKYLNEDPNIKTIIVSGDKDMVQLYNNRTEIITINGIKRSPKQQIEAALKQKINTDITATDFLLFKILIGDHSDDIPNIKTGIGPKKAFQLVLDKQKLKKLLKQDKLIAESFLRNKKLISMNQIPEYISKMIIEVAEQNEKNNKQNQIIF